MRTVGIIILILGFAGIILSVIQLATNAEVFGIAGLKISVDRARWAPLAISIIITIVGYLFYSSRKDTMVQS